MKIKRSKVYTLAAEKIANSQVSLFICNEIKNIFHIGARRVDFPEIYLFKENEEIAWFGIELKKDEYFSEKFEREYALRHNLCKSIALLLCAEMAKDTKN